MKRSVEWSFCGNGLVRYKLWDRVDPNQKEAIERAYFTDEEAMEISWYLEVINMMLWCINLNPYVLVPTERVDPHEMGARLVTILNKPLKFIKSARLKSTSDILDMLDLKFQMHINCSEAYKKNEPMPGDMNFHVVVQRHAALAWVANYGEVVDRGS